MASQKECKLAKKDLILVSLDCCEFLIVVCVCRSSESDMESSETRTVSNDVMDVDGALEEEGSDDEEDESDEDDSEDYSK